MECAANPSLPFSDLISGKIMQTAAKNRWSGKCFVKRRLAQLQNSAAPNCEFLVSLFFGKTGYLNGRNRHFHRLKQG